MLDKLFGFLKTKNDVAPSSPITPYEEGSSVVTSNTAGCYGYQFNFDIDSIIHNEVQMVNRYRDVANYPDCDTAIEQIVNEAVIVEEAKQPVSINLESLPKEYKKIKSVIEKEFNFVLTKYRFNEKCHDIFKRWYIDGRLYYFVMVDQKNPKRGIIDVKYIDPRKIRKIVNVQKEVVNGVEIVKDIDQYYLFNDKGLLNAEQGIRISPDVIVDVKSGIIDANSGEVVSYLYKAIKPVNQLKMMEDALVIYRIVRAPERRVFYVDVGNLPSQKAEQHVQNIMSRFRNKVVYDAQTGEVKNNRNYLSMMEDFWLPRREGGRATEVQTLPAGQNLSDLDDVIYFQNKLYQALGVPKQRLNADNNFALGRPTEITREEILFGKFVQRLRNNFNTLFRDTLKIQLVSKNIIKESDWDKIKNSIFFTYQHDNYFEELKRAEIFNDRLSQLQTADSYKGTYFSKEWIAKNVMKFSDEEWKQMKKEMDKENSESDDDGDGIENDFDFNNTPPKKEPEPREDTTDTESEEESEGDDSKENAEEAKE